MRDEPLETLAFANATQGIFAGHEAKANQLAEADLLALERMLDAPGPKPRFPFLKHISRFSHPMRLSDALVRRAEEATVRVWLTPGADKTHVEEGLLRVIAFNARPSSLPFFRAAIAFTVARDQFAVTRRRWAVAGIAFLAMKTGDGEASAALDALLEHDDSRVRTWVVDAIGRTRRTRGGKLVAEAVRALRQVAHEDRAFEPRYLARGWLALDRHGIAPEPAGGVYAFKATFGRASRVVELRSEQAIDSLAWAIVGAFDWDDDHLYAFTLGKQIEENGFEPEPVQEARASLAVGALGMSPGHRFTLLYDFGDSNVFAVELIEVRPKAATPLRGRCRRPPDRGASARTPHDIPRVGDPRSSFDLARRGCRRRRTRDGSRGLDGRASGRATGFGELWLLPRHLLTTAATPPPPAATRRHPAATRRHPHWPTFFR